MLWPISDHNLFIVFETSSKCIFRTVLCVSHIFMFESLLYGLLILYIVHEARVMLLLRHFCKVSPCSHSHWHCLVLPYLSYWRNCMVDWLVHLASLLCQASLLIKHDRSTQFFSIVVIVCANRWLRRSRDSGAMRKQYCGIAFGQPERADQWRN